MLRIWYKRRIKYILLLFSWPPDCAVRPNYEVMMFQPRSGTDTSLGSVAIVMSYLKTPSHRSIFLWIRPLHPPCTDPPYPLPPWYWAAPLFTPDFSPSNFEFNNFVSKFEASQNFGYLHAGKTLAELQKKTRIMRRTVVLSIKLDLDVIFKALWSTKEKIGG